MFKTSLVPIQTSLLMASKTHGLDGLMKTPLPSLLNMATILKTSSWRTEQCLLILRWSVWILSLVTTWTGTYGKIDTTQANRLNGLKMNWRLWNQSTDKPSLSLTFLITNAFILMVWDWEPSWTDINMSSDSVCQDTPTMKNSKSWEA